MTSAGSGAPPGSIPARAGEPLAGCGPGRPLWVYPRPCGGAAALPPVTVTNTGLSPPVRGSPGDDGPVAVRSRSIPARAGEPGPSPRLTPLSRVYPRPCGGAPIRRDRQLRIRGLSPPVRGSPAKARTASSARGSIPARAGEPTSASSRWVPTTVYPRPCGGARTGRCPVCDESGLSPPVRGSQADHVRPLDIGGSIPARAGEPRIRWLNLLDWRVYPRPCGGAFRIIFPVCSWSGLSPPVRGSLFNRDLNCTVVGSIPARAGEPRFVR